MAQETRFTPGPWKWFGQADSNSIYLATTHSGRRYVMDFVRWGMQRAQPRFQPGKGIMVDAKDLLKFEVGDQSVVGVDAARKDPSVYRMDVRGVDCPDAHLIASAPELYAALEALVSQITIDDEEGLASFSEPMTQAHAALAKARGEL